ncbi:MAG: HAMP domain-containing protein, partial [Nisaea sp.]|uniref:cache domain-containing protein n=1 Tax=Nisaea sp. TaxID=2024842 RepID=UPI001B10E88B
MLRSLSLRTWLFVGFAVVSWFPIAIFAGWAYVTASDRIEDEVRDRLRALSQPLALALERFAADAVSAAEFIVSNRNGLTEAPALKLDISPLLDDHRIRSVALLEPDAENVRSVFCAADCVAVGQIDPGLRAALKPYLSETAARSPDWVWTGVLEAAGGVPTLFLLKDLGAEGVAVASVTASYIQELQSPIRFGQKGHAAVVDREGRVLAHPLDDWVRERKDLSEISVVQAMSRGESGIGKFYSPAMDTEMVAGFASVSGPGWGVMVPQPRSEIVAPLNELLKAIVGLALAVGIFITVAAWFIAGLISRGVRPIEETAARIADGDFDEPVATRSVILPVELDRVASAIDTMAEQVGEAVRARIESQARAHRIEQMDRAKSVLLANVSHEFRTPLN